MGFQHYLNGLLFTLLLRGGFPTQGHGTGERDSSLLVIHSQSSEEDNARHTGPQAGLYLGTKWTLRVCGRQALWYQDRKVPIGSHGTLWLAWIILQAGPSDKGEYLTKGSYLQEQSRKANLQLGHSRPFWFYHIFG